MSGPGRRTCRTASSAEEAVGAGMVQAKAPRKNEAPVPEWSSPGQNSPSISPSSRRWIASASNVKLPWDHVLTPAIGLTRRMLRPAP